MFLKIFSAGGYILYCQTVFDFLVMQSKNGPEVKNVISANGKCNILHQKEKKYSPKNVTSALVFESFFKNIKYATPMIC